MRAETFAGSANAFDLVESTTSLACAHGKVNLVVQLKREIGKLWDDITKAPYKELFNHSISGMYVWRCVQVQRGIDETLEAISKDPAVLGRDYGVGVHGNRLIASMVFSELNPRRFNNPSFDFDNLIRGTEVAEQTCWCFQQLKAHVEEHYGNAIIPTLFKNQTKCKLPYELEDSPA